MTSPVDVKALSISVGTLKSNPSIFFESMNDLRDRQMHSHTPSMMTLPPDFTLGMTEDEPDEVDAEYIQRVRKASRHHNLKEQEERKRQQSALDEAQKQKEQKEQKAQDEEDATIDEALQQSALDEAQKQKEQKEQKA